MESIVILLTGTIKAYKVPQLVMTDTDFREREYCKAIKKWMTLGYPIIFCENSNYKSEMIDEAIKDCAPGTFEYLKFISSESHLGKGRGEAEILEYVFKNSKLINNHSIICKATGKNFVSNAGSIFKKILSSPISKSLVIALLVRNLALADTKFFFFKKDFYLKYWVNNIREVNEPASIWLEHTLAKAIHLAIAAGEKWSLPPELHQVEGYCGTNGKEYKNPFIATKLNSFYYSIIRKWVG